MQVVASGQEESLAYSRGLDKKRDADDILYIMTKDGNNYQVKVKDFSADGFDSANADGIKQHIQVDQIASIQKRETDTAKSVGLVGAIFAGIIIIGVMAANALVNDMFQKKSR